MSRLSLHFIHLVQQPSRHTVHLVLQPCPAICSMQRSIAQLCETTMHVQPATFRLQWAHLHLQLHRMQVEGIEVHTPTMRMTTPTRPCILDQVPRQEVVLVLPAAEEEETPLQAITTTARVDHARVHRRDWQRRSWLKKLRGGRVEISCGDSIMISAARYSEN